MSNFTENEIIPFALSIIQSHKEGIDTKNLIIHLRELMNPYGEDLEILTNRNDDKFSQKVRNLKSHKTLENKGFVSFNNNKFYITKVGTKFLIESHNYFKDINILDEWELTTRTYNSLKDNGINTLSELLEWSEKKFLTIPGFGKAGISEINNHLNSLNLKLGTNLSEINKRKIKTYVNNKNISQEPVEENTHIYNEPIKEKDMNFNLLSINILEEWPLSVRTYNALKKENIIFLGDLISYNFEDLLKLKNFGRKSLNEIKEFFQKNKIVTEEIYFDQSRWEIFLENNKNKLLKKSSSKNTGFNNLIGIKKSIFKNYQEFKNDFFNNEKIKIDINIENTKLEEIIIKDIEYILSLLNDRMEIFFKGRYGYKEEYKTLEELGKKFQITRERVRQLEKSLNLTLPKLGKTEKNSLIDYFNKYKSISFHKLFPTLDKFFTDTAIGVNDITNDKLTEFIENYCGVDKNYFSTPERELKKFNLVRLKEIFLYTPSGKDIETFIKVISDGFGYDEFTSKAALNFMSEKELIKIHENKVYPIKMRKYEEVSHILLDYPDGLHWKEVRKIGNNSFSNNIWDETREVYDTSFSMEYNPNIYLIDKGKHRLIKYLLLEIKNREHLISKTIEILKELNLEQSDLEHIYKKILETGEFDNLNFYNLRAIIKIFGKEKGLYHLGRSGTNTIGLNKNIKVIPLKIKIKNIIEKNNFEITTDYLNNELQKTTEQLPLEIHLDELVEEAQIFKINPGSYLNLKEALKSCDKEKVINYIKNLLENFKYITISYIRENLNQEFDYENSNFYYDTLVKIISKENNWIFKKKYLSKERFDPEELDEKIKNSYDMNLNINENYSKMPKDIGISMLEIMDLRRQLSENYKIN